MARSQALTPLAATMPSPMLSSSGATVQRRSMRTRTPRRLPFDQEINSVSATSSGLSVETWTVITGSADSVGARAYQQGSLYDQAGYVRDASTGAILGRFQLPAYLIADGTTAHPIVAVTPDLIRRSGFRAAARRRIRAPAAAELLDQHICVAIGDGPWLRHFRCRSYDAHAALGTPTASPSIATGYKSSRAHTSRRRRIPPCASWRIGGSASCMC